MKKLGHRTGYYKSYFKCEMCKQMSTGFTYQYRATKMIPDYDPPLLGPVCRKCCYKEYYGHKQSPKKMKEKTLDEIPTSN